jgi:hypothetical protein
LTADDAAAHVAVAGLARFAGVTTAEVLDSPIVLAGTADGVVERLRDRRRRWGYSSVCLTQDQAMAFSPVVQALSGS